MPESEQKLIELIRRKAGRGKSVVHGIGDDAAVLRVPPGHEVLITTDFSIENVHFRRNWHDPETIGWRCLTRGLSDIAAMGGEPQAAFLSLAVAGEVPQKWIGSFLKGLLTLAKKYRVPLAGGDTAQAASGIQADIVVVGSVPRHKAILRSGARPGDSIYSTGRLGGSAYALSRLMAGRPVESEYDAHFRPVARVAVGQWLRRHAIPSAMIDISDGLSTDLGHICKESQVGAVMEAAAIPRARCGPRASKSVDLHFALHGGDDYELLFTSSRSVPLKIAGVPITRLGQIIKSATSQMTLLDSGGKSRVLKPQGWEHFTSSSE